MRRPPARQIFLGTVIGLVVLAVMSGLVLLGSPGEARIRRLDERRVADLRDITLGIDHYRNSHDGLPDSIGDLSNGPEVRFRLRDPITSEPYEYRVLGSDTYELCARFERGTPDQRDRSEWLGEASWDHGSGRQCFRRKAREK